MTESNALIGQDEPKGGSIVVVAKCPIPGKSKTRLAPLLGSEGAAFLARALLSDVLVTLSQCSQLQHVQKCLLYAPGNDEGLHIMTGILRSLHLDDWRLLPMRARDTADLLSSDVGSCMADALERVRELQSASENVQDGRRSSKDQCSVLFLGMDAPELPVEEIITALAHPEAGAVMCPASDGGFAMLSLPQQVPLTIFENVRWSQSLTAVSQLKALTDANIPIRLGRLMHDMDEAEDVKALAERLCKDRSANDNDKDRRQQDIVSNAKGDCLLQSSRLSRLPPTTGRAEHTWKTLVALGLIEGIATEPATEGNDSTMFRIREKAFAVSQLKP